MKKVFKIIGIIIVVSLSLLIGSCLVFYHLNVSTIDHKKYPEIITAKEVASLYKFNIDHSGDSEKCKIFKTGGPYKIKYEYERVKNTNNNNFQLIVDIEIDKYRTMDMSIGVYREVFSLLELGYTREDITINNTEAAVHLYVYDAGSYTGDVYIVKKGFYFYSIFTLGVNISDGRLLNELLIPRVTELEQIVIEER